MEIVTWGCEMTNVGAENDTLILRTAVSALNCEYFTCTFDKVLDPFLSSFILTSLKAPLMLGSPEGN